MFCMAKIWLEYSSKSLSGERGTKMHLVQQVKRMQEQGGCFLYIYSVVQEMPNSKVWCISTHLHSHCPEVLNWELGSCTGWTNALCKFPVWAEFLSSLMASPRLIVLGDFNVTADYSISRPHKLCGTIQVGFWPTHLGGYTPDFWDESGNRKKHHHPVTIR